MELSFAPPLCCRLPGDLLSTLLTQLLGPRMSTLPPKLDSGLVLAVVGRFLDLAGGDLGHGDGSADHVSGAFLTFGAFGHESTIHCLLDAKHTRNV